MPPTSVASAIRACRGRVLDIGAADEWLAGCLDPAVHYVALDYPTTAVALYGTRPHVFADACRMPFLDASFDAVACYEVMEHVRQPDGMLAEVARVLVAGGVAELTMPYFYPIHDAPHDYQRWTRHGWWRSVQQAGLEVASIETRGTALQAAAVTSCLALAGPVQRGSLPRSLVALPFLLLAIPVINLSAWLLGAFWPSWDAMSIGYRVIARKPE